MEAHSKPPKGKSVHMLLGNLIKNSKEQADSKQENVPMITLKHRWMKRRTLVSRNTAVPFNEDGIAKIPDVANARIDCEILVKNSHGLISFFKEDDQAKVAPSVIEQKDAVENNSAIESKPSTDEAIMEEVISEDKPSLEGKTAETSGESDTVLLKKDTSSEKTVVAKKSPGKKAAPGKKQKKE